MALARPWLAVLIAGLAELLMRSGFSEFLFRFSGSGFLSLRAIDTELTPLDVSTIKYSYERSNQFE
jgi:hypothetical protein